MRTVSVVVSPCRRACGLDPLTGACRGCLRTAAEIAAWRDMTEHERLRVMSELPSRPGFGDLA